jgi:uroporphyrin-III C-methyltransferase
MWRPWFPWAQVLLVSLVLIILIGGLTVGDFYWNDLRPDMGRIGANLAQVRDRQRVMMGHFAEAQALLLEQQRHLVAQAQDLRRREQALYESRLEIDAQRAQLAQALQAEAKRQGVAAARLAAAADLAQTAAEGLRRNDDLDAARVALALAAAVLADLPGPAGDPGRAVLGAAQARLAEVRPVDRATLARRLQAVREQAIGLRPVAARLLLPSAGDGTDPQGRRADPVSQAAKSLDSQFEAARLALDGADSAGFSVAMQGIDRWLSAYYEPRLASTAAVLTELGAVTKTPITADVAPLSEALVELGAVLRKSAGQAGDK